MLNKINRFIKIHGVKGLMKKAIQLSIYNVKRELRKGKNKQILNEILKHNAKKKIIIFYSPVPWNLPLYQRPHHIALQLSKLDYLYFYCTNNPIIDKVNGFKKIEESCYLTDQSELLLNLKEEKIIHIYSTDMRDLSGLHKKAIANKDIVLYEYIDEIHQDITGEIPAFILENHNNLLEDEDNCIVIASADKLLEDVMLKRKKNFKLVTNGVDVNHFKNVLLNQTPNEIQSIIEKNVPIIGYFGAFAAWFDYDLIKKLAQERPQYEILLIGWDYDKSISKYKLNTIPNITVTGPIHYNDLPCYAQYFDVSIIPFLINQVTESTSPVKLFEYMAMGKPIVTTNMKECKKYNSVLISESANDFIIKIDQALNLREDFSYLELLDIEANRNKWSSKAKDIKKMINTK